MNSYSYDKHQDWHREGGLNINESGSGMGSVLTDIVKQMGKKMLEGNMVDMLKISRPAKITSPTSHLISFSKDFRYTDLMNKAAEQTDPIERMKYVTTFLLAGLYCNPLYCKSKAPLNPILGETFQSMKSDGTVIYLEQTSHHPPTSNYHLVGPEKNYELFGFAVFNAHMTGMNSIKGWREGKSLIRFKDGTLMTYTTPDMRINGLIMGDRTLNFSGTLTIKDYKNKIESITHFPYKDVGKIESIKSTIGKIFWSKAETTTLDEFIIQISQLNKETKVKDLICEGHGSWLGQIYIEGKRLWSYTDSYLEWSQKDFEFILPSDSSKRTDLVAIENEDYENAQKYKDELENLQRKDKKLREERKK